MVVVPVILSGGAGSRLWPVSRDTYPKPFIKDADGISLIQHAFRRMTAIAESAELLTVTNRELLFVTEEEYAACGKGGLKRTYLLEPAGRDTAPAIAAATVHVKESHGPDAILCVAPADHMVSDMAGFLAAIERGVARAGEGKLVTFGIRPARPETGFGYIEARGEHVLRFIEKPDLETAERYVAAGNFYWNSGMFCFQAATMEAALTAYCPQVLEAAQAALAKGTRMQPHGFAELHLDPTSFEAAPKISIDYAVMERAEGIAVVPCDIGWSDIGSWNAMADLVAPDKDGNRILGNIVALDTRTSYIRGSERLIATMGVEDLVIVDSPDALLVTRRERAQDTKQLYDALKLCGREEARLHRTVHRPWGSYTVLETGYRFKIKRLEVKRGGRLSLQLHHHRAEHWVVVSGTARIVNGDEELILTTNQSTYIPCGAKHRLENVGILPLVLIEVQSGDYLGEDDIVRFDDAYHRS
ncbi:mannose-1-phosphate guanylyltransferase/mannose-6-phosphate isomerase [Afifella pfennigii]|uniref:mannose-1-phosphate guanylyltransferase/mannose-6-phosphate isomerase n=1 Tax=Afifella pfennigii TaxID=209897 RepID=UPI00047E2D23|nr:mannose-1-phosphate guanylyltransferase/mannose-6-phosphate isomerase [Afifella pfennigii]